MSKISPMNVLSINPIVAVVEDFATEEETQYIIDNFSDKLEPGVIQTEKGIGVQDERCTHWNTRLNQWEDPTLAKLVERISLYTRLPPENSENGTFMRYQGDQEFKPHCDAFVQAGPGLTQLARGGQRVFSSMIYLNDVDNAGQTEFPALGIKISPKRGRLLIFSNTRPCSLEPHPQATHAGLPLNGGEKFAIFFGWRQLAYYVQREYPDHEGESQTV